MSNKKTIRTCNGVGDFLWLVMKLINQPEKIDFIINSALPQRAHQLATLFPSLINSISFEDKLGYNTVKRNSYSGQWSSAPKTMYLEANGHLEAGKRIETFLPDLKTSFVLDYVIDHRAKQTSLDTLYYTGFMGKYIGIYTTSYNNARHMSGWLEKEWFEFISLIQQHNPAYKFVFIGAEYDLGVSQNVMAKMKPEDYINAIGQPLPVTIEILKRLDMFAGFQSGLSIINETIGAKQTLMFYADALRAMINTWADPARIESGSYKGCLFCEPKKIFDWLIENKKI